MFKKSPNKHEPLSFNLFYGSTLYALAGILSLVSLRFVIFVHRELITSLRPIFILFFLTIFTKRPFRQIELVYGLIISLGLLIYTGPKLEKTLLMSKVVGNALLVLYLILDASSGVRIDRLKAEYMFNPLHREFCCIYYSPFIPAIYATLIK
ncbi:hypothetical protein RF11_11533 [Thelohanellus kitauei]|uniref:Uncharacterized protein n=1 Tax=Thelohanellus kitauei TaxID=669202 RepID=A0A0C2NGG3_THEKT|nr:hypothetical protein RF11_11533 [Thelohanellus kitauei]